MTTRRAFLTGSAALAAGGLVSFSASAQPISIGAVKVDARSLGPLGWGENAPRIGRAFESQLVSELFSLHRRGGPTLHVTVLSLWLGAGAGSGSAGGDDSGSSEDNMESVFEVIDRGRPLMSQQVRSMLPSTYAGAWYRPDIEQRRIAALLQNNALWIRRYLGA